jgi:hypothetical protein
MGGGPDWDCKVPVRPFLYGRACRRPAGVNSSGTMPHGIVERLGGKSV